MKLMHITIQTNNFDTELQFYQQIVGLTVQHEMNVNGRHLVFLSGNGETNIELIDNPQAVSAGNENLSLGFKTENVEDKRNELLSLGYEVSEMISPMPQAKFFFVKDPAGVTLQFMGDA